MSCRRVTTIAVQTSAQLDTSLSAGSPLPHRDEHIWAEVLWAEGVEAFFTIAIKESALTSHLAQRFCVIDFVYSYPLPLKTNSGSLRLKQHLALEQG